MTAHITLQHPEIKLSSHKAVFTSILKFVTTPAGPVALPNQPHLVTVTVSGSVKWKEEESKLFVPWALTGGYRSPVLAKDKSNGICSGEAVCVAEVLLMGDRGESPPLKPDKYLCGRGGQRAGQPATKTDKYLLLQLHAVSLSLVTHVFGFCPPIKIGIPIC